MNGFNSIYPRANIQEVKNQRSSRWTWCIQIVDFPHLLEGTWTLYIYYIYNRNILGKPLTTMNAIGYNNGIWWRRYGDINDITVCDIWHSIMGLWWGFMTLIGTYIYMWYNDIYIYIYIKGEGNIYIWYGFTQPVNTGWELESCVCQNPGGPCCSHQNSW